MLWQGSAQPSLKMTAAIAVAAFAIDFIQYRPPIGLEPMGALLLICCSLKLLEMRRIREARLVLYLCYFIASIQLIFEQAIWYFCMALFGILVTMTAQNMAERDPWQQYSLRSFSLLPLKSVGRVALVSIPLALAIFVFAPRLPSFWAIPIPGDRAKTGVSEVMTPSAIAELTRSGKLAFRVAFEGEIPPRSELYWRGLVLSDFDGQSWSNRGKTSLILDGGRTHWSGGNPGRVALAKDSWTEAITYTGKPIVYDVYQEPSGRPWLFSIAAPTTSEDGAGLTKGLRLVSSVPVTQRIKYRVKSYPDYSMTDAMLTDTDRLGNLGLPGDSNPRTRQLAQRWAQDVQTPALYVEKLFAVFNREHTYTLEPGTYSLDAIDEFLFDRKRGFCGHFAQATVFFLRAAGIPARVVTGYQGGEIHPDGDYLLVHQYDAHAWAEYWVDGRGWVQADPTAAVSPARIEFGAREVFDQEPEFLSDEVFSLNRLQDVEFLNWLRLRMDGINYLWISWVLGYDNDRQIDFLEGFFGKLSYKNVLMYSASVFATLIAGLYLYLYLQAPERKRPRVRKYFDEFRSRLISSGLDIKPGYTPARLAAVSAAAGLDNQGAVRHLAKLFERHFYTGADEEGKIKQALRDWGK